MLQFFFDPASLCEIIGRLQMIKSEFQHVSFGRINPIQVVFPPYGGFPSTERQSTFACSMSFLSFSLQDANTTACAKKRWPRGLKGHVVESSSGVPIRACDISICMESMLNVLHWIFRSFLEPPMVSWPIDVHSMCLECTECAWNRRSWLAVGSFNDATSNRCMVKMWAHNYQNGPGG